MSTDETITSDFIICPNCETEFQVTEAIESQIGARLRVEVRDEMSAERSGLSKRSQKLDERARALEAEEQSLNERIRTAVAAKRETLLAETREQVAKDFEVELKDQERRIEEFEAEKRTWHQRELDMRERERAITKEKEELALDVGRQMDKERAVVRAETRRQAAEEHRLKEAEKEKQIADMRKTIDDLKHKAEQGSQQLQGEVLEIDLEAILKRQFPFDAVLPVPKGVHGGDIQQRVAAPDGRDCGTILWELKRTKNWSDKWLEKLRDDQRSAKASCAVIVSEVLPEGVTSFSLINGVWVCSRGCAVNLAEALRVGMIQVTKAHVAAEGRHEKVELVYGYLASADFQRRVAGMVEALVVLRADLDSEKRAIKRQWAKREKQLERATANVAGMYGDIEGIIGAALPEIEELRLLNDESATKPKELEEGPDTSSDES